MREVINTHNRLNLFSTDGRLNRSVYFLFSFILPLIIFWVLAAVAGQIARLGGTNGETLAYIMLSLALVTAIVLLIALTVQRVHDFDKSGWLSILLLIFPPIIVLYWLIPGSQGVNSYGKPVAELPKFVKVLAPLLFLAITAITAYILAKIAPALYPLLQSVGADILQALKAY